MTTPQHPANTLGLGSMQGGFECGRISTISPALVLSSPFASVRLLGLDWGAWCRPDSLGLYLQTLLSVGGPSPIPPTPASCAALPTTPCLSKLRPASPLFNSAGRLIGVPQRRYRPPQPCAISLRTSGIHRGDAVFQLLVATVDGISFEAHDIRWRIDCVEMTVIDIYAAPETSLGFWPWHSAAAHSLARSRVLSARRMILYSPAKGFPATFFVHTRFSRVALLSSL
ncbi:hypothetical protein R3P38DRAFT_3212043 [Favolaschia claudopus]|uniref:Uncharacterized protein n=1 Tax=Favolaschia claudopus TaxID=2862362 RepID=A0AAW0AF81_9AGAR